MVRKNTPMIQIIAECCQNHKGDLSILKDMVWAAAAAGAHYAKIQSMLGDELTYRKRFEEGVIENGIQKVINRPYQPEYERLRPMDLNDEAHHWFVGECQKAGIKPLTTVFTRARIPFLARLPWRAIKVASYDCASYPMLRDLMAHFNHLYISTGATYDAEVIKAAQVLGNHSYTFLHCITIYPTPLNELNLMRMDFLRQFTKSVGFSDHSLVSRDGLKASIVAILLGADVIERHFTILKSDETKDGSVSINPEQLQELVEFSQWPRQELEKYVKLHVPEYPEMIGLKHRTLSQIELLNRDYYRGRFASKINGEIIYNWEDKSL